MFDLIIAGGREFRDYELLKKTVDRLLVNKLPNVRIVCGMAKGADELGYIYAKEKGLAVIEMPAKWKRPDGSTDRGAGHKRNAAMAGVSNALLAFWDGKSKGTEGMIKVAKRVGLQIRVVRY